MKRINPKVLGRYVQNKHLDVIENLLASFKKGDIVYWPANPYSIPTGENKYFNMRATHTCILGWLHKTNFRVSFGNLLYWASEKRRSIPLCELIYPLNTVYPDYMHDETFIRARVSAAWNIINVAHSIQALENVLYRDGYPHWEEILNDDPTYIKMLPIEEKRWIIKDIDYAKYQPQIAAKNKHKEQ